MQAYPLVAVTLPWEKPGASRSRPRRPGFTLRTYAHLMVSSEGKAKTAIDRAFAGGTADVPEASQ